MAEMSADTENQIIYFFALTDFSETINDGLRKKSEDLDTGT